MSRRQQNTSIAGVPSSTDNGRHVLVFQQKDWFRDQYAQARHGVLDDSRKDLARTLC